MSEDGVSIQFFCAVMDTLREQHGEASIACAAEIRPLLARVESLWRAGRLIQEAAVDDEINNEVEGPRDDT